MTCDVLNASDSEFEALPEFGAGTTNAHRGELRRLLLFRLHKV